MANFRGMDGSILFAANAVAEIKGWEIGTDLEVLDDTVQGDPHRTVVGGVASWEGSGTGQLDYGNTLGQKAIIDKIATATPPSAPVAAEFIVNATGPKKFTGNILITGFRIRSQTGSIVSFDFTFVGSGQLTPAWT